MAIEMLTEKPAMVINEVTLFLIRLRMRILILIIIPFFPDGFILIAKMMPKALVAVIQYFT